MALPRLIAACSLAVVLVSGCGSTSDEPDRTPSPTTSSPTQSATTPVTPTATPTTPAPTATPTTPAPTPTPTAAPPPVKEGPPAGAIELSATSSVPQFDNETATVTCLFDGHEGNTVRCDVMPPSGWKAARPGDCQDAYGDAIMLAARARLICHGDTIWSPDTTKIIRKGQTYSFNDVWCTAASATEVTCRNADGRGFSVTQRSYRIF